VATSYTGNMAVVGYSDDSLIIYDIRSNFRDKIWLESGGHYNTVRSVAFPQNDVEFLCLTAGSDS
jgi:hypothetical protein